ncbi:hypothetical protein CRYUN_Cryun29cG0075600 [Craigia yunnanensis]
MEKQQEDAYKEAIEEYRTISRARIAKLLESHINNIVGILPRRQTSNYFVQFRKIANHPLLVRRIYNDEDVVRFAKRLHSMGVFECTLDRVIEELKNYNDFSIHRVTDRQTTVDDFNNDTSIFACLSTRAGGQGLNLRGADTVVIHDMDFNPQIDRQAEDHCHRIGQTRPVTIYRLVTKGTVDENVYEIAKRKLFLDAAVLESGIDVDNEGDASEKPMGQILSSLLIS